MAAASPFALFAASKLLLLIIATSTSAFQPHITSLSATSSTSTITPQIRSSLFSIRGGSDDEYDNESEYDESEGEEEDEPIVVNAKKLASSAKNTVIKKKSAATKAKVAVAMAASKPVAVSVKGGSRGGVGSIYRRYVPYIVRACLNPFMLVRMTKSYFASLVDINYLKEVSTIH